MVAGLLLVAAKLLHFREYAVSLERKLGVVVELAVRENQVRVLFLHETASSSLYLACFTLLSDELISFYHLVGCGAETDLIHSILV